METIAPEEVGLCGIRLERIGTWLQEQVDSGRLAGCSALVAREGKIAYHQAVGQRDVAQALPFTKDTVVRIFSMTKPITTVAAMMLYERGAFQFDDPVALYLPEFAHTPVWQGGAINETEPQKDPMTVRHLMTHTSGLTYGFMQANAVDAAYREARLDDPRQVSDLAQMVQCISEIPLLCQPGSQWNYSVSTDVLGRLVEVWSGKSLREFILQEICQPLNMQDTDFHVSDVNHERFASLYVPASGGDMSSVGRSSSKYQTADRGGLKLQDAATTSHYLRPATIYSGGGGLVGSIKDYARFCQMLLNGGALENVRLLSRKTVEYMFQNQLPDNRDMAAMGQPVWSETSYDGIGFGLGGAVVLDPIKAHVVTSPGEYHWGGAASTFFWIDPEEDLTCVFFTQLMPSSTYPIRRELRVRVYQALVD